MIAHQRSREGLNVFEQGRTIHDLDTSDIIGTPAGQSCAAIRKKPALASGAHLLLKDEPPSADPHARWCGRGPGAIRAPIPMYAQHGRELMGCKSPVCTGNSKEANFQLEFLERLNTRRRQLRKDDRPWEGSLRMLDRRRKRQRSRQDLRGYEQKSHQGRHGGRACHSRRSPDRKMPWR